MKLIPNVVFDFPSRAEKRIFELLHEVDLGNDWVAFHSLNCSEHAYKQWSEMDFVLVGSKGIFVLEVKGGGVSYREGIWYYENRYGQVTQNSEGPFNQAKSARFSLEKLLENRFGTRAFEHRPVFGFGVVFPDTPWSAESPEMPRVLVADRDQCATAQKLANYLETLIAYWTQKRSHPSLLTTRDRKSVVQMMRPDVDVYPPFSLRLGQVLQRMQTLTDEQFERLDALEANDQAIVSGGAGTGKTFLLMQAARREASRGARVLVVTESEILAAHLRRLEPDHTISIRAFGALEAGNSAEHDVLFVDEGQDLLSFDCLDRLGSALSGGLEQGRWRWFMDENNQSRLRGHFDPEALTMLTEGLGKKTPIRLPLKNNVRNTREIVSSVEKWTGASLGKANVTGRGEDPSHITVTDRNEAIAALVQRIDDLQTQDIPLDEVAIIAPKHLLGELHQRLPPNLRKKCLQVDKTTVGAALANRALIGTAADFKGLERPIVIVVDVETESEPVMATEEFYVATTRANYDLTVITSRPPSTRSQEENV